MYEIIAIVVTFIICVLILGLYEKSTNAICKSKSRLDGKTVLITGGSSGMGFEIAKDLAHRGAKVIIACPFKDEGEKMKERIVKETENEQVFFEYIDLSSLVSIRKFASHILDTENRLDILINNAGVAGPADTLTSDGMHYIMQVNYYGPFLLTILLLPLLKKAGTQNQKSRIIVTSSVLHRIGYIDYKKINSINQWSIQVYGNSKLCLVLFANELAKRMKNFDVVIHSVDPGAVGTNIFDAGNKVIGFILKTMLKLLFKTPWEGAQTALHAVLDKETGCRSGLYLQNCDVSKAAKHAYCDETSERLWEESIRLVNLTAEDLENSL